MSHENPEPTRAQSFDRCFQPLIKGTGGRLEQDPSARSSERQRGEVAIVQLVEHCGCDLTAWEDPRGAAGARQRVGELVPSRRQLVNDHRVVGADVGRCADRRDPVGLCLHGHGDGVVEITRSVVDARQEVTVEVDRPLGAGRQTLR